MLSDRDTGGYVGSRSRTWAILKWPPVSGSQRVLCADWLRPSSQPVKDALLLTPAKQLRGAPLVLPTFFVGDEMFFGKGRIIQIEEMIQQ